MFGVVATQTNEWRKIVILSSHETYMILIPYFDLYKQYLEHSECLNIFDKSQQQEILSNTHSLSAFADDGVRQFGSLHSLDQSWNCHLEFHRRMATSIRTKTFMFDRVFGKTCVHKVRNHTRLFTPFGKYHLKNGEIYETNNEKEHTKVKSLPTPHYTVEFERHTYRRHPHSSLELSIDILTQGDYKVSHQLLSGQSFSTVIRENGENRAGERQRQQMQTEKATHKTQKLWVLDYFFETRNNPSETDTNRELDHFIVASNYQ